MCKQYLSNKVDSETRNRTTLWDNLFKKYILPLNTTIKQVL